VRKNPNCNLSIKIGSFFLLVKFWVVSLFLFSFLLMSIFICWVVPRMKFTYPECVDDTQRDNPIYYTIAELNEACHFMKYTIKYITLYFFFLSFFFKL